jgi:hypothetical protein
MKGCRRQRFGLCKTLRYSILRFGRPCDFVFRDQRKSQRAAELTRAYGGERRPNWVTFFIFQFSIFRFFHRAVLRWRAWPCEANAGGVIGAKMFYNSARCSTVVHVFTGLACKTHVIE